MNMRAMNIALPDLARQKAPLNVKDSAMTGRMYRQIATLSAICGMAFLSACSVAPEYAVPQMTPLRNTSTRCRSGKSSEPGRTRSLPTLPCVENGGACSTTLR